MIFNQSAHIFLGPFSKPFYIKTKIVWFLYPVLTLNCLKTIPFTVAYIHIASSPPPPPTTPNQDRTSLSSYYFLTCFQSVTIDFKVTVLFLFEKDSSFPRFKDVWLWNITKQCDIIRQHLSWVQRWLCRPILFSDLTITAFVFFGLLLVICLQIIIFTLWSAFW